MIEAGLGLDRDVGLVAVPVLADALVHVAGFGVDGGNDPVRGDALGDAPRALALARLHVLARHQGQQAHRVGLVAGQLDAVEGGDDRRWRR